MVVVLVFPGMAQVSFAQQADGNTNDFVEYWAAARQVLAGGDPYGGDCMLAQEREAGFGRARPLFMPNPPWIVPVIAPFGMLSFRSAQRLWFGLNLIATLLSARWLWEVYGEKTGSRWIPVLVLSSFLPIAAALAVGQVSPLILLGLAGFIYFEERKKPALSGAFLFLVALKPHLVFLLWVAILLRTMRSRSLRTLSAFGLLTGLASLAAFWLDHSIFTQYFNFVTRGGILTELTPTFGGLLRMMLGRYYPVQVLPELLALVWFLFYGRKWRGDVPVLLLVSVLTVSYSWFFDQVVLLPCLFQGTGWAMAGRRLVSTGAAAFYLATNAAVVVFIVENRGGFWYAWTVPAWCLLYGFVRVMAGRPVVATHELTSSS